MSGETAVLIIAAVLGSSVLTVVVGKYMDRRTAAANVLLANAETKDLMTQAWERSMRHMSAQMELQQRQIYDLQQELKGAHTRIEELTTEVKVLEAKLGERRRTDGDNAN